LRTPAAEDFRMARVREVARGHTLGGVADSCGAAATLRSAHASTAPPARETARTQSRTLHARGTPRAAHRAEEAAVLRGVLRPGLRTGCGARLHARTGRIAGCSRRPERCRGDRPAATGTRSEEHT